MSQSPDVGSVTPTLRAKDLRSMKLGVLPRTLWSNDQDPVLLVFDLQNQNKAQEGVKRTGSVESGILSTELRSRLALILRAHTLINAQQ